MAFFERVKAEEIRDAEKTASGNQLALRSFTNTTGDVLFSEGKVVVSCLGQDLVMWAKENEPDDRQIMLVVPRTQAVLFRLCHNRNHGDDIHWHHFEGACTGAVERIPEPDALASMSLADLVTEVFVPKMRVTDLLYQGVLLR